MYFLKFSKIQLQLFFIFQNNFWFSLIYYKKHFFSTQLGSGFALDFVVSLAVNKSSPLELTFNVEGGQRVNN